MNKIVLLGRVGQDPKITNFDNDGKIARLTIATTEKGFTTKAGKKIEDETTWHNIVVRKSGIAGIVEKYVHKGDLLLVEGKLKTRKWTDKDGAENTSYEIHVEELELLPNGEKKPARETAPEGDDLPW